MMLPSVPAGLLAELELAPRFAIERSMKEAMIDCAGSALVEEVVADEPVVLPVSALSRV
jgi:hypothetical protein